MKINELTGASSTSTYAKIDAENDTMLRTEDLIKIKQAQLSSNWTGPMTSDELDNYLRSKGINL